MRVEVPAGCRGIDAPNGKILRPKRGTNVVEINDPTFARQAQAALGKTPDAAVGFSDSSLPSVVCSSCGFHRFAFSDRPPICPRCGAGDNA